MELTECLKYVKKHYDEIRNACGMGNNSAILIMRVIELVDKNGLNSLYADCFTRHTEKYINDKRLSLNFTKCFDGAMEGFLSANEKLSPDQLIGSIHVAAIQSQFVSALIALRHRQDDLQHDITDKRAPQLALDKLTKEIWRG